MKTRVEELETVNQSLRNRDKLKDDAIAQLSDQIRYYQQDYKKLKEDSNWHKVYLDI